MHSHLPRLSHKLLEEGFFSALGSTERMGMGGTAIVKHKEPMTMDFQNGIHVIYDEVGRPWITPRVLPGERDAAAVVNDLACDYGLRKGAYVPHANDGGHFLREILPDLMVPHIVVHS